MMRFSCGEMSPPRLSANGAPAQTRFLAARLFIENWFGLPATSAVTELLERATDARLLLDFGKQRFKATTQLNSELSGN